MRIGETPRSLTNTRPSPTSAKTAQMKRSAGHRDGGRVAMIELTGSLQILMKAARGLILKGPCFAVSDPAIGPCETPKEVLGRPITPMTSAGRPHNCAGKEPREYRGRTRTR